MLYAAREALMLIYVSALIAMGFSPLVQRHRAAQGPAPSAACRASLAILVIYLAIIGVVVARRR